MSVLTDQYGAVYQSLEYYTDGGQWIDRGPSDSVNRYLFNGKPFDRDTGFYDYGQRFYDPRTSLWLGADPAFTDSPGNTVGHPLYPSVAAFSGHSPARFRDVDGRDYPKTDAGKRLYGQTTGVTTLTNTDFYDPPGFSWDARAASGADAFSTAQIVSDLKPATIRGGINAALKTVGPAVPLTPLIAASLPADVALGIGMGMSAAELSEGIDNRDPAQIIRGALGLTTGGFYAASRGRGGGGGGRSGGDPQRDYLLRFGQEHESAARLGAHAANAESQGWPHGVSTRRVSESQLGNYKNVPHRRATVAEAQAHFEVDRPVMTHAIIPSYCQSQLRIRLRKPLLACSNQTRM